MIGDLASARAAATAADPRHVRIETIKLLCTCASSAGHDRRRWSSGGGVCDFMANPIGPPVYLCPGCRRFFPWCQGAASEDNPEFCDDCWADTCEGASAP